MTRAGAGHSDGRTADLRRRVIEIVQGIQLLPYAWPTPPDAASARILKAGSCASKHGLLAESLQSIGVVSLPVFVVGTLVPGILADDPDMAPGRQLPEVHEFLTVLLPWAGPVRVDITWDPPLIERGLPGTLDWDAETDMLVAVGECGPGWAVQREGIREAKEALRRRLYGPGDREIRDRVLEAMANRFATWRGLP